MLPIILLCTALGAAYEQPQRSQVGFKNCMDDNSCPIIQAHPPIVYPYPGQGPPFGPPTPRPPSTSDDSSSSNEDSLGHMPSDTPVAHPPIDQVQPYPTDPIPPPHPSPSEVSPPQPPPLPFFTDLMDESTESDESYESSESQESQGHQSGSPLLRAFYPQRQGFLGINDFEDYFEFQRFYPNPIFSTLKASLPSPNLSPILRDDLEDYLEDRLEQKLRSQFGYGDVEVEQPFRVSAGNRLQHSFDVRVASSPDFNVRAILEDVLRTELGLDSSRVEDEPIPKLYSAQANSYPVRRISAYKVYL